MNSEIKEGLVGVKKFFSDEKTQWMIFGLLALGILLLGIFIRIQPVLNGNLIDPTTEDYTPLALDPYYFLRMAETMLEFGGDMPEFDSMRDPAHDIPWHHEILSDSMVWTYKIVKVFDSDVSFRLINVLNPVIFFVLGLLIFGFLVYVLTKNKWISLISIGILTVIPPYLYRTLAGFSDHESIGMFGFFLALLLFFIGLKYLDGKKLNFGKTVMFGLVAGFGSIISVVTWTGVSKFLFMILPLAFIGIWFTRDNKSLIHRSLFYSLWFFGTIIFAPLFGIEMMGLLKSNILNSTGLLSIFLLGFIILETIVLKINIPEKIKKNARWIAFFGVIVLGMLFYQILIGHVFEMIFNSIDALLHPFGTGRVTMTVAENAQPYLNDLMNQIGKSLFYVFILGCLIVGIKVSEGIKIKKYRYLFGFTYILFILGILYSRVSPSSILNGSNFVSKAILFISILIFVISTVYVYIKSEWKIKSRWIFILAWMVPMLLAVRSASRVFFLLVPFISFMIPLALFEVGNWGRKSKDDLIKLLSIVFVLVVSIFLIMTLFSHYNVVKFQAENQTPSYNPDWQNAMAWVRNNTPEDSLFLHWWDYGYWVQTGGERTTIVDGGYHEDYHVHAIGRYVLTTPYPETAKSYMKTYETDYLLIDPTDIGKYTAYSSIGDDNDSSDRKSYLSTFVSNINQIQETRDEVIRIYSGGIYVDEDIFYENENGTSIFLPRDKSIVIGFILTKNKDSGEFSQPIGVYSYNGKQYQIPLRYLANDKGIIDFESGINSMAYLYPNLVQSSGGQQLDSEGALMYLSEKTKDSLVVQLYVMGDPNNLYQELELVHSQSSYPIPFYYQGYRGPIRIYKINRDQMEDILVREEFFEQWPSNTLEMYGAFDDLDFKK